MPVTDAFTLTSLVAAILLSYTTRQAWLDVQALRESGTNGILRSVAATLLRVEISRLINVGFLLIAGLGILVGFRVTAYLIALVPLNAAVNSVMDIRARRRQLSGFKR